MYILQVTNETGGRTCGPFHSRKEAEDFRDAFHDDSQRISITKLTSPYEVCRDVWLDEVRGLR